MKNTIIVASLIASLGSAASGAWIGKDCGSSILNLDPNPPRLWAWANCEEPLIVNLCQQSTNGWFSAIGSGGNHIEWRTTCCPPSKHAIENFVYDDDGNLVGWGLVCSE